MLRCDYQSSRCLPLESSRTRKKRKNSLSVQRPISFLYGEEGGHWGALGGRYLTESAAQQLSGTQEALIDLTWWFDLIWSGLIWFVNVRSARFHTSPAAPPPFLSEAGRSLKRVMESWRLYIWFDVRWWWCMMMMYVESMSKSRTFPSLQERRGTPMISGLVMDWS